MQHAEAHPEGVSDEDGLLAHSTQFANQLSTAAMRGDKLRVTRLLLELVRVRGIKPRRLALLALTEVFDSLRSVAMTDELTGLHNRRGFLEVGTRFLEVARRDLQCAYLVYFDLNELKRVNDTSGHAAGDALIRHAGAFLRELFPSYGVYEVIGRLGGDEFAALTADMKCPSRREILLRARTSHARGPDAPPLSLSVGLSYFNPLLPMGIDELLRSAEQAMYEHKRVTHLAWHARDAGMAQLRG